MRVLAIDPGPERSAWVTTCDDGTVRHFGTELNETILDCIPSRRWPEYHLAIEMVACYGMPVGAEVFETCVWIGRFIEAFDGNHTKVYRRDVKLHLCNSARAKDANVRQALIDRFGPGREKAIGTKKNPGPLYGIKADLWAALGVAVTWWDQNT